MDKPYKVRYGILNSSIIFNEIASYRDQSIDDSEFRTKLEESILNEGFRNPILIDAGWCPETRLKGVNKRLPIEMQKDLSKILTCNYNGSSRLEIAQKYNLDIPCVINDFVNRFSEFKLLKTEQDVINCFTDEPFRIKFYPYGLRLHLSLGIT